MPSQRPGTRRWVSAAQGPVEFPAPACGGRCRRRMGAREGAEDGWGRAAGAQSALIRHSQAPAHRMAHWRRCTGHLAAATARRRRRNERSAAGERDRSSSARPASAGRRIPCVRHPGCPRRSSASLRPLRFFGAGLSLQRERSDAGACHACQTRMPWTSLSARTSWPPAVCSRCSPRSRPWPGKRRRSGAPFLPLPERGGRTTGTCTTEVPCARKKK